VVCASALALGVDVDVKKPHILDFAGTARWLAHENMYGVLGTTSVRLGGAPFTQPKSFVDGSVDNSTGILYFYDAEYDESLIDIASNNVVSFSLSAAQLGNCPPTLVTDPQNPMCARVTFAGKFVSVTEESEKAFATDALFARHPIMPRWPDEVCAHS